MHAEYAKMHLQNGDEERALVEGALTLSFLPEGPTCQEALDVVFDPRLLLVMEPAVSLRAALGVPRAIS
jgi:hypothetical protein